MNLPIQLARGLKRKAYDALSLDRMNDKFKILAINYIFLMVYFTLESVFVNTLILRVSGGDMHAVLLYRAFTFAFSAIGMNLASVFSHKISSVTAIRVAGALYVLLFSILFVGMERVYSFIYFVGAISGLAGGFYFSGHVVLLTNYTTQQNRAVGIAIVTITQGVTTLLMPLISGIVIGLMPYMIGYRVMFGFAIAAVLAQVSFMRKLSPVPGAQKKSEMRFALNLIFERTILRAMLTMEFVRGLRDGVFAFFLNIVLFEIVKSESLVGFNTFLAGLAAILAAWLYGRLVTPRNRAPIVAAGITALLVFCSMLLLSLTTLTIILFSIINAFLAQIIVNCAMNNSFDIMGQDETTRGVLTELLGFREIAMMCGRIGGVVVVSLFPSTLRGYVYAMLTLTAIQYIMAFMLYVCRRISDREQGQALEAGNG